MGQGADVTYRGADAGHHVEDRQHRRNAPDARREVSNWKCVEDRPRCCPGTLAAFFLFYACLWPYYERFPGRATARNPQTNRSDQVADGPSELRRGRFQGWVGIRMGIQVVLGRLGGATLPVLDSYLVGAGGIEPPTSWSQTRRAAAALRPDGRAVVRPL